MAENKFTIKINSILGGHAPTTHFSREDQFKTSLGIDPSFTIDDNGPGSIGGTLPSGLLRPVNTYNVGTTFASPRWIKGNPKEEGTLYVYDTGGSVYTVNDTLTTLTGLGDLNDGGIAQGNGMEYYDNYMYFARATTVARYGPLNGTAAFTDDYWVSSIGQTALTNTQYPVDFDFTEEYPNHVLHRHSDGKLYIADVVGNQGTLHYIQTSKTTAEGDTNNGSTFDAVNVGFGLWPTAMESYGSDLAIAFIEIARASSIRTFKSTRSKIAFWDTTSANVNKITWVEFPDQMITALKNVNGILYVVSGNQYTDGFRVSRFIGGYSIEEVAYFETGQPAFPGALDGVSSRLYFGSWTNYPERAGCVYSLGLQKASLGAGVFNTVSVYGVNGDSTYTKAEVLVTALNVADSSTASFLDNLPILGISTGGVSYSAVAAITNTEYGNSPSVWWSRMLNIGQPFKITKIRIPLAQRVADGMTVTPKIYLDEGVDTQTLEPINWTNYPNKKNIVIEPTNLVGDHNFWLELRWTGSVLCTVGLPITIEYELIDD